MKEYVLGFVVDEEQKEILLCQKSLPHFLKDRWTGFSAAIDSHQLKSQNLSPCYVLTEQCFDQTDLVVQETDWLLFGYYGDKNKYQIQVYWALSDLNLFDVEASQNAVCHKLPISQIQQMIQDQKMVPGVEEILSSFLLFLDKKE